ncbi:MAG: alpha/beta fold hydrolase [Myxococcota bacterium]
MIDRSSVFERDFHTGPRGLRLRIREHGADTGTVPLVVLHGFLEHAGCWDDVAVALQPRHVVAVDLRGHGGSDHIGAGGFYHFWDYVADVVAVIEDLGGSVDLLGHSMGGSVCVLVAGCVPDCVRKLVLVEGIGPPDGQNQRVRQARKALKHRRNPPEHRPIPTLKDAAERLRRGNPDVPEHRALSLAERATLPTPEGRIWRWDALHRARSPQAFSADQFMSFLQEISSPTLLIEGADSPFQHIPDLDKRRDRLAHASRVVLEGCGHHPHYTHVDAMAKRVLEHLNA